MEGDEHNALTLQTISCDTPEQCRHLAEIQREAIPSLLFVTLVCVVALVAVNHYTSGDSDEE